MCLGAAILGGLGKIGTIVSTIGTLYSAGASYASARAGASQARANANLAEQQGLAALEKGRLDQQRIDRRRRSVQGQQRAMYGASGLDPNTGSPLDVQADTEYLAEQDKALVRYNAELQKWGFDVERANYNAKADQMDAYGTNSLVAGVIGAGSNMLNSDTLFSPKWNRWARQPYTGTYGTGAGASGSFRW
jgi:hypothetical protein